MTPKTQFVLGCLSGVGAAVIWGLWAVLTRDGVNHNFSAAEITLIRALTSTVILLPIFIKQRCYQNVSFGRSLILAAGAGAVYTYIVSSGLQFVPAGHLGIFSASTMLLMSSLGGYWLLGEDKNRWQILGYIIIISAIVLVNYQSVTTATNTLSWLGDLMLIAGGALWAVYTILTRVWKIGPWQAVSIVSVYSSIIYVPLIVITDYAHINFSDKPLGALMAQIIGQGILTAIVALILYTWSVKLIGASKASVSAALVPSVAVMGGFVLLNEIPTSLEIIGLILTTVGILFVLLMGKKPLKST